jgi:hypothetical protein
MRPRTKPTFWWLLLEEKSGTIQCPFCHRKYSLEKGVICPHCYFKLTPSRIKYMLRDVLDRLIVKKKIKEEREIDINIEKLSCVAKVEYDTNSNKPIIKIDSELISKLNKAPIGEKRISYLFCLLLHEVAHILGPDLYGSSRWSEIEIKGGKQHYEKIKFDDTDEYRTMRYVERFLRRHDALYTQYKEIKTILELPDLELPNASELCSVATCLKLARYQCEVCNRKLCEDHIKLNAHNPCRYLKDKPEEMFKKKYSYRGDKIENGKRIIFLGELKGKRYYEIYEEMVNIGMVKKNEEAKIEFSPLPHVSFR